MQSLQTSLLARDDTFLGVCEGLGEDFGFNANYLRVGFALLLFFNPIAAIAGYLGAGVLVAFSRVLAPNPRILAEDPVVPAAAGQDRPEGEDETDQYRLPIAA